MAATSSRWGQHILDQHCRAGLLMELFVRETEDGGYEQQVGAGVCARAEDVRKLMAAFL